MHLLVALTTLGLTSPPVHVRGVAEAPDPDAGVATLLDIQLSPRIRRDAPDPAVARIRLPARDKPGVPQWLALLDGETELCRLALAPERDGRLYYSWSSTPIAVPDSLRIAAPIDTSWMGLTTRRKLSRTLELELVGARSGRPIDIELRAQKRPVGLDPRRLRDVAPSRWAASIPALEAAGEAGHYALPAGVWRLDRDLVVPRGAVLHLRPGTSLRLAPSRSIVAFGRLEARGTAAAPIAIRPLGRGPWGVVALLGEGASGSQLEGVRFVRGSQWFAGMDDLTGTLTIRGASARVAGCWFEELRGEDAIHAEDAELELTGTTFAGLASDGVDLEGSRASISGCDFARVGDDAIDVGRGSHATITGIRVQGAGGKALSAGQRSTATIADSRLLESGRGISSFDGSSVTATNTVIAFARRAAVQAAAGEGKEPGRARLEGCVLWKNGGPGRVGSDRIEVVDTTTDRPPPAMGGAFSRPSPGEEPTGEPRALIAAVTAAGAPAGERRSGVLLVALAVVAFGGLFAFGRRARA